MGIGAQPCSLTKADIDRLSNVGEALFEAIQNSRDALGDGSVIIESRPRRETAQDPAPLTADVVRELIARKRAENARPKTIQSWKAWGAVIARKFPRLPLTAQPIRDFLADYASETATPRVYHTALKGIYKVAADLCGVPNVMAQLNPPRVRTKFKPPLSLEQVARVYQAIETLEERAVFWLAYGTPLRPYEAAQLNGEHVGDRFLTGPGKEREEPVIQMPWVRDVLLAHHGDRAPDAPLFRGRRGRRSERTLSLIAKVLLGRAGINGKGVAWYKLRRSYVVHRNRRGGDVFATTQIMRHTNPKVTFQHYGRQSLDDLWEDELRVSPGLDLLSEDGDKELSGEHRSLTGPDVPYGPVKECR